MAIGVWDGANMRSFNLPEQLDSIHPSDNTRFALGHVRLSVIDLSEQGNQPMYGCDGQALSFNGTIYNYVELRAQLLAEGIRFSSSSDTEVLLRLLCHKGTNGTKELNGAWGFTFVDPKNRQVTLSRDPYGERPLYYFVDETDLIVASEINAIFAILGDRPRSLDVNTLITYLAYQYWPTNGATKTFYTDIRLVPAGTNLTFDLDSFEVITESVHTLSSFAEGEPKLEEISDRLRRSIEMRLRADVPIGVAVSGGVDSSAIAAMIQELDVSTKNITFYTAKFPKEVSSDLEYANQLARDLEISLRVIDIPFDKAGLAFYHDLLEFYGQPIPVDGSTITESLIFRAMADDGNKVAITGTGGDEIFGGYGNEYIQGALNELLTNHNLFNLLNIVILALRMRWITPAALGIYLNNKVLDRFRDNSPYKRVLSHVQGKYRPFMRSVSDRFWARDAYQQSLAKVQMADCTEGRLPNYVAFGDTNAMIYSIDNRCPFLDPNLSAYINLPVDFKYAKGVNKWALRSAIPEKISKKIIWRSTKQGLSYYFEEFYRHHREHMMETIAGSAVLNELFKIRELVDSLAGSAAERKMIFAMYSVAAFSNRHRCVLSPAGSI